MAWDPQWDDFFSARDWGRYPNEDLVRFIGRHVPVRQRQPPPAILEIGCATGANLWYLAREGFQVHAIDGSSVAVGRARQRCREEGFAEVDIRLGDAMHLPYADASMDLVIDIECLYANSKADSRIILHEIARVLRPGGRLFSTTFSTDTTGCGTGTPIAEDEPTTYAAAGSGSLNQGYGLVRYSTEADVNELYGADFDIESIEYASRTRDNRQKIIGEWLITCRRG